MRFGPLSSRRRRAPIECPDYPRSVGAAKYFPRSLTGYRVRTGTRTGVAAFQLFLRFARTGPNRIQVVGDPQNETVMRLEEDIADCPAEPRIRSRYPRWRQRGVHRRRSVGSRASWPLCMESNAMESRPRKRAGRRGTVTAFVGKRSSDRDGSFIVCGVWIGINALRSS